MAVHKSPPQASVTEVLDRVLDRGIVIDVWLRVSLVGIALIDVDARVVVASISTYVQHSDAVAQAAQASRPLAVTPDTPPPARPQRRARIRLQCEEGCTFIRTDQRVPARVRCPSTPGRTCPVTTMAVAA